ncbi:MAG TPA: hypothetical protein DHN29_03445 [Cytophagales bacterium]|nr:hypothetical protein [Cytophagales bacterium]
MPEDNNIQDADPKYTAELDKLEKATGEEPSSSKETSENGDDSRLVEKDGEFYLISESEESETVDEPVKGESETEEPGADETAVQETEDDIYAAKTRDDIIDMHRNAQRKLGEQGDELGKLRDVAKRPEELTDEELFDRLSAQDFSDGLKTEKQKLDGMDPYDTDGTEAQKEIVRQLEDDLIKKTTQETIAARMDGRDNEEFVSKQKQAFEGQGIKLNDEEFGKVSDAASNYTENGLLTERSFHKGLVDQYGLDHVMKHFKMSIEKGTRQDIQKAAAKTTEKVDVRGSGKSSKLIKIADLGRNELKNTLDNLSVKELQRLRNQYVK